VSRHRASEIAKAVDRQHGGFVERADKEGAGNVGTVMFHVVDLEPVLWHIERSSDPLPKRRAPDAGRVARTIYNELHVSGSENLTYFGTEVGAGVARDRDMVDLVSAHSGISETPADRLLREASGVLNTI
jgi:hypothetical protein